MIDVLGLIKLSDNKERIHIHQACMKSFEFIDGVNITVLNETPSQYGYRYMDLLLASRHAYVCNYIEDCFMLLNDNDVLRGLLETMHESGADVMKASFHQIEWNSVKDIKPIFENEYGFVYRNTRENHNKYQQFYGSRFYAGVNWITSREFAMKFWDRPLGRRPHEYELPRYDREFEHTVMIPKPEVMASVDDGHGLEGSNLLARNEPKFWNIYNAVIQHS